MNLWKDLKLYLEKWYLTMIINKIWEWLKYGIRRIFNSFVGIFCFWDADFAYNPIENEEEILKEEKKVDKKINKILKKEKSAVKETKQLLKMDKKQDKKLDKLEHKKKK